jgi:BirA family transcriptional regulator, biotin operon repressor / biotin---[acetyl-CoA-carboxylase] ligase
MSINDTHGAGLEDRLMADLPTADRSAHARERLLHVLADGHFHSGEQLAADLAITRAAVWKQLRRLGRELDIEIQAVRGRGYRLGRPVDLLDGQAIRAKVSAEKRPALGRLEVLSRTGSTNDCARSNPPHLGDTAHVWLAEVQTAGRGRHGRRWVSAFGSNLTLSISWRFDQSMRELSGLSLACGAVLADVLSRAGLTGHRLKWPNDVVVGGRKLAGILVELSGEAHGPTDAVIGLGVNVQLPPTAAAAIDQPWTDLWDAGLRDVSRNDLAGAVVDALIGLCRDYPATGLVPHLDTWRRFDACAGRPVSLVSPSRRIDGVYNHIDTDGAVVVETAAGPRAFHAGELSLRVVDGPDE